jgi:hypothetical protein
VISLRSKYLPFLFILFLTFFPLDPASGQTYPRRGQYPPKQETYSIHIRYQDARQIPSLDPNLGLTVAVAPFSDSRRGWDYIGRHTSRRISGFFKSEPFPLEQAIREFFFAAFSDSGIHSIFVPSWDGKPETLPEVAADSILRINIRRFWIETELVRRATRVKTWVYFDTFLGVKKENRVFTQNLYLRKEMMDENFTPERLEQFINRTLSNVFDDFIKSYKP